MVCYNSSCASPSVGVAASTFASAVQYFAAAQCLVAEGVYKNAKVKDSDKFDIIIVGAGSAGSVLANRLSEVSYWNVLIVEAGDDPPLEAAIPYLHSTFYLGKFDWGYLTVDNGYTNQANINGSVHWPRGKMIGGCSNMNTMAYVKGNNQDYQRWYDAGNTEWSLNDVHRCFRKAENFQDMKFKKIPYIYNHYGHDGPLVINSFNSTNKDAIDKVLASWAEIGIENVPDLNVANAFGSAYTRATAANGVRNSVSKAYLRPIQKRNNLKILKNAFVTKILIDSSKKAYAIEVEQNNKKATIYGTKEIVISAGSINSPHLLMSSGVGPKKHLKSKNIRTVINLPMVGKNLQDHSIIIVPIFTEEKEDTETEADASFQEIEYLYKRTGRLAQLPFYDIVAFLALEKNATYPDFEMYVKRVGRNTPNLKDILVKYYRYKDTVADSIVRLNSNYTQYEIYLSQLHPYSRGHIALNSANPRDLPRIYANYFEDARDLDLVASGLEIMLNILNTKFFKSVKSFLGRVKIDECDKYDLGSRQYLKCFAKNTVSTIYL